MLPIINTGSVLELSAFSNTFAIRQYRCARNGRPLSEVSCRLAERRVYTNCILKPHVGRSVGWVGWV